MLSKAYTIEFTGFYQGREYYLRSYEKEYRNLMILLKDKICLDDDFGQCGGMGRCGTCLVSISGLPDNTEESYRNEQGTLSKMGITDKDARLACQMQVDEDLNKVIIEISDNYY